MNERKKERKGLCKQAEIGEDCKTLYSEHLKTVGVLSVASRGTCSASADSMLFRTGDGEFGLWSSVGGRSPQLARPGSAARASTAAAERPKGKLALGMGQVSVFHAPRPMDGTTLLRNSSTAERALALPASRLTACFFFFFFFFFLKRRLTACFGPGVWMRASSSFLQAP